VLEVPLTYEGVRGINVVGDNLYLSSDDNRTMVYALSTGAQLRQLFGYVIALDRRPLESVWSIGATRLLSMIRRAPDRQLPHRQPAPLCRLPEQRHTSDSADADQKVRTMDISAPVAH